METNKQNTLLTGLSDILEQWQHDRLTDLDAVKAVHKLLGKKYKPVYRGLATVRTAPNMDGKIQTYIYEGHTAPITGLYCVHEDGYGVYEDGSREFTLDLSETKFPESHGYDYTVIHEKHLDIHELYVDGIKEI